MTVQSAFGQPSTAELLAEERELYIQGAATSAALAVDVLVRHIGFTSNNPDRDVHREMAELRQKLRANVDAAFTQALRRNMLRPDRRHLALLHPDAVE